MGEKLWCILLSSYISYRALRLLRHLGNIIVESLINAEPLLRRAFSNSSEFHIKRIPINRSSLHA